ncbi:hypothetical protein [uncultured Thiodictyon sp.]|uniref:hypothetical protein n=1 Tax=uncultured Thiodictyon sp. TaxID=1846217 RepID=UPI0025CC471A|nr:hypothetical protein [uncultured Thiodictyon sp.]
MIIEQLSKQAVAETLATSVVTGRFDLEGVGLLVLEDGRILLNEANHQCTVRGSAQKPLTPYQLAQSSGVGYRLWARGLITGATRAYA